MLLYVKGRDLRRRTWLFGAELVARKEEKLQPALRVFTSQGDEARDLADVS